MLGSQKGKKWLRNHRKTADNCAKKDWLNKENNIFFRGGRVSKTGRIFNENGGLEIFPGNGRFPAKKGGFESVGSPRRCLLATHQQLGNALQKEKKIAQLKFHGRKLK